MPFVLLLYPSTKMPVAARYNASVGVTGRTQAPDEDARDALTWQTASSANADFVARWSASDWLECPRERSSWRGKGRPRSKLWRIFAKVWFARLLNIRFTPTIAHHWQSPSGAVSALSPPDSPQANDLIVVQEEDPPTNQVPEGQILPIADLAESFSEELQRLRLEVEDLRRAMLAFNEREEPPEYQSVAE